MDNRILDEMEACFGQELALAGENLGCLEKAVTNLMTRLGQGLLQRMVSRQPNGYKGSFITCKCGSSMRFVSYRYRQVHTVYGWIGIKRAYYHCPRCGNSFLPYDRDSGLGTKSLSPGLARACCVLAVDDSFKQAARKIEELLGQKVSDKTLERVVHQVGSAVIRQQDARRDDFVGNRLIPDSHFRAQRLYVCADGTTVHEKDGWHEAQVGTVYWENQRFERQKRYIGRFDDSAAFGIYLWLEACRCGYRETDEVVYIGDGSAWIRTIHNVRFRKAVFIVDWFHASEHVWDCGKVLFGEGTMETEKWVRKSLNLLWEGYTRKFLKFLEKQRSKYRGRKSDATKALHHYISVNEEQMRYDVFRAEGYDIGSGAVEAACKNVVGKRLKQSGMIWTRGGSSATLALRTAWLNMEWEDLWSRKPLAA
jgi:hypothetical protein